MHLGEWTQRVETRLDDEGGVKFQFLVWGWCLTGPDACEYSALVAEGTHLDPRWDRTRADLADSLLDNGRGWERVPDHWALPWLVEHRLRHGDA